MRYFRRHPVGLRFRLELGLTVAIIALVVAVAWCGDRVEAQGTPEQVTGVSAMADDHASVTVSWNAVANSCGNNGLFYEVRWDDDSGFASPQDEKFIADTIDSYQITGLQDGIAYFAQVRGVCLTGGGFYATMGAWSAAASATTDALAPAQVTGLTATAASDTEIDLEWNSAARADAYRIGWGTTSGDYSVGSYTHDGTPPLRYGLSGLTPDTTYYFQAIATRSGAADGTPSAEATADTETPPTPAQVTGVAATAASDSEIEVEWDAAQHATGYIVEWDTTATFDAPDQASVIGTRAIIERLRAETEYFVRVAGTRAGAANGAWSAADTATTETARLMVWADRVPGGAVGAQLGLAVFGGVFAGFRFRTMKTPRREALILLCMCGASLLLPLFGVGNLFWTGGIVLLAAASSAAVFFLASRA